MKAQAGTYWDFNSQVLRVLVEQRTDARIGLPLLILGFALQFVATLNVPIGEEAIGLFWALLVAIILGCIVARPHLIEIRFLRLLAELRAPRE